MAEVGVFEARELVLEDEVDLADRAVALLGDDQLGDAPLGRLAVELHLCFADALQRQPADLVEEPRVLLDPLVCSDAGDDLLHDAPRLSRLVPAIGLGARNHRQRTAAGFHPIQDLAVPLLMMIPIPLTRARAPHRG